MDGAKSDAHELYLVLKLFSIIIKSNGQISMADIFVKENEHNTCKSLP